VFGVAMITLVIVSNSGIQSGVQGKL